MRLPLNALMFVALAPLIGLCACVAGPGYSHPPVVSAAQGWTESASTAPVEAAWWRRLNDPTLDGLIETALMRNLDLRQAEAQLREARANRSAAAAAQWPQIEATGTATRNALSANGEIPISRIPGFTRNLDLFDVGFDASWEVDLWGRVRRSVQAADARAQSASEARHGVQLSVIAETARTYIDLRSAQARLASARRDADARRAAADLVAQRYRAGEATLSDVARAESQARSTLATLPGLEADTRADAYALAALTGQAPEALISMADDAKALPEAPGPVSAGLRSDLLRRRPDVRKAERDLAAATADIGAATADLFPRLTLVGAVGRQAKQDRDLTSSLSTRFQAGPSLTWPIFSAGRIKAQIRAADARAEAAGDAYENTVLTALADSETALNRYASAGARRGDAEAARRQADLGLDLERQRYEAGEDDLLALLQSQSDDSAAGQAAISAQADELAALVSLYKALGGGWEAVGARPQSADASRSQGR